MTETAIQIKDDQSWRPVARGIAAGGALVAAFAGALALLWYHAATLFLIFAGVLFGVGLNAVTQLLGRKLGGPHALRLVAVCLVLTGLIGGVLFLGGATIADQAKTLSVTIKSQIVSVKTFLEQHGVDTSYLDLGSATNDSDTPAAATPRNLPSAAREIASSGGAIVSQTLKLILGLVGAVGNFFIVLFLGLCFAAQPHVYRNGLVYLTPEMYRPRATILIDRIGETLERWLIAQMTTMLAVFAVTWIGLMLIGVQSAFILGVQAGLLAFIPTVGAIVAGLIVVIASLASGWVAAVSAFVLFLGVHAMESYVLTPILQRQALDIPPATLFGFQILFGVIFGIWGLALALPVLAIAKVAIDYARERRPEIALVA